MPNKEKRACPAFFMHTKYNLITILGPTATGKTTLAAHLANKLGGEVISADSRQIYKGMDIGTGKDLSDFTIGQINVPYHLIDIVNAGYKYNVFEYQRDFISVFNKLISQGKIPVLCGGSGLYIEAILKGYRLLEVPPDEALRAELAKKTHEDLLQQLTSMKTMHNVSEFDTKKRAIRSIEIEMYYEKHKSKNAEFPKINSIQFGIHFERSEQRKRISERLDSRLRNGMVEEIESLLKSGIAADDLIYYGLEYKYITQYLLGQYSYDEMHRFLEIAIHQFLKRQDTWFRRMERNGMKIHWINGHLTTDEKIQYIMSFL